LLNQDQTNYHVQSATYSSLTLQMDSCLPFAIQTLRVTS